MQGNVAELRWIRKRLSEVQEPEEDLQEGKKVSERDLRF
jgi:hypothetical protein